MDNLSLSKARLYRKHIVQGRGSTQSIRVAMTSPTRRFLLALHRLRLEGLGPFFLEKRIERYLEDNFP